MATTMVPPTGTPRPAPPGGRRVVSVRADLLPDEVVSARRAVVVRNKVLIALGVLAAFIVAGYGLSWWQTTSARGDLGDMQQRNTALTNQQNEFRPVVEAQSGAQRIQTQLRNLMAGDVAWNDLLGRMRKVAPAGVALTGVDATVTVGPASTGTPGAAAGSVPATPAGPQEIGILTLTGTGPDKNSVAAFGDKLGGVGGLASPLITSVSSGDRQLNFTVQVVITSDALSRRYSGTTRSTGGK
jgi:Tfp pilus assembly protein PilN